MTAVPPDRAEPAALYAAAQSAWVAGQNERAGELLEAALAAAVAGSDLRADVLCAYARLRALAGGAPGLAEQLTDEAPSYGPQARCRVLVEAAYLRLYAFGPETVPAARAAHLATTTDADVADEVTRARAAIILGGALALAGETAESAHYLNASVDLLRVTGSPQELVHLLNTLTVALTSLERYDDAHAVCRRQVRVLRTSSHTAVQRWITVRVPRIPKTPPPTTPTPSTSPSGEPTGSAGSSTTTGS